MDEQKQKLIERIAGAQNILVTVSANPSVDQLSAAIGLTLVLNKIDKHGTAVFSGAVPSTLEFLKPEETLEKNTDSLRDFIIALDKSKADKLRYKVEDDVVRIFITPYRTSLSEKDLQFSEGDFNVDVVVCLGVTEQQDLDVAITSHGRILHDATVASISTTGQGSLGSINWVDPGASSLSEMMVSLADGLNKKAMDAQVATALLTGIVASTERFRNDKTSPKTMSAAATLMAAGANQQLIATELETAAPTMESEPDQATAAEAKSDQVTEAPKRKAEPGTLEINHEDEETSPAPEADKTSEAESEPEHPQIQVDENGQLLMGDDVPKIEHVRGVGSSGVVTDSDANATPKPKVEVHRELLTNAPELTTPNITANTQPEGFDPPTEELTLPPLDAPLLSHNESVLSLPPAPAPITLPPAPTPPPEPVAAPPTPPPVPTFSPPQPPINPAPGQPVNDDETLTEIEQAVDSPHLQGDGDAATAATSDDSTASVDNARSAVEAALKGAGTDSKSLDPIAALNAQPLGGSLQHDAAPVAQPAQNSYVAPADLFSPNATPPVSPTVPNTGFSEPTPGSSPADATLDMPLPTGQFGQSGAAPGATMPPSAFPGVPGQPSAGAGGQTPPPPVPPPMVPPLQQ
jgi:hypothetical protein